MIIMILYKLLYNDLRIQSLYGKLNTRGYVISDDVIELYPVN